MLNQLQSDYLVGLYCHSFGLADALHQ
jgi:hypothetical protein